MERSIRRSKRLERPVARRRAAQGAAAAPLADERERRAPGVAESERVAPGTLRRVGSIPRSRGLLGGFGLALLGLWGALIPFVGPYFHYAFVDHRTWDFTYGRLWLEILPGAVAFLAGIELMRSANRPSALLASAAGILAGGWLLVGPTLSMLWNHGHSQAGRPLGSSTLRAVEQLGYFNALGALILLLGASALGRLTVVSRRDERTAYERERAARGSEPAPRTSVVASPPPGGRAAV